MKAYGKGVYPAHLFYTLQAAGSSSHFAENGMAGTEPVGIGMALLVCLFMGGIVFLKQAGRGLAKEEKQERKTAGVALALGIAALAMSPCYFPWDFLSKSSGLAAVLIGSLQFPTRLTGMVGICMVTASCIMGKWFLREKDGALAGKGMLLLVSAVSVLFGCYQLNDILLDRGGGIRLYTAQNLGHSAVLGAEYVPEGADLEHLARHHEPVLSEGAEQLSYSKEGLHIEAYVKTGEEGGYIEYPLLYYKGYEAWEADTGEKLALMKGDNADVRVQFPENFSGRIQIGYKGMWYWHMAEVVSIAAGTAMVIWYCGKYFYGKKQGIMVE